MDINDPKYIDPGTDPEARAKLFIYDWLVEGTDTIAGSRDAFEFALMNEFHAHADAVRRQIEGGK